MYSAAKSVETNAKMPPHIPEIDKDQVEAPYIHIYSRDLVTTSTDITIFNFQVTETAYDVINTRLFDERYKLSIDFQAPSGVQVKVCRTPLHTTYLI